MTLSHGTWGLLIGIDCYIRGNVRKVEYRNLRGCVSDVRAVKKYLDSLGVQNVAVLTSSIQSGSDRPLEDGTAKLPIYENVARELEYIIANASPGDLVYIHYSGHGIRREKLGTQPGFQRFTGDQINGTALALADVMDEGVYLTGYQLGVFVKRMVKQKNLRVTLVLDSCFSGQGFRGPSLDAQYVAFRTAEGGFDDSVLQCDLDLEEKIAKMDQAIGDTGDHRNATVRSTWLTNPTGCTILTACDFHQSAREETRAESNLIHGAFTFYMLEKLQSDSSLRRPTHASVKDYVQGKLRSSRDQQSPVLHGDGDHIFFGRERIFERPVCHIISQTDSMVDLDIGSAQGVVPGAVYNVFLEDQVPSSDTTPPFTAWITETDPLDPFRSRAYLSDYDPLRPTDPRKARGGSAMLSTWAVPDTVIKLSKSVQTALSSRGMHMTDLQAELAITQGLIVSTDANKAALYLDLSEDATFQIYTCETKDTWRQIDRIPNISITQQNAIPDVCYLLRHIARFQSIKTLNQSGMAELPENCLDITIQARGVDDRGFKTIQKGEDGKYHTTDGAVLKFFFRLSKSYIEQPTFQDLYLSAYMLNGTCGIQKHHPAVGQPSLRMSEGKLERMGLQMEVPPPRTKYDADTIEDTIRVFLCTTNISWEDITLSDLPKETLPTPLAMADSEKIVDPTVTEKNTRSWDRSGRPVPLEDEERWGYIDIVVETSPLLSEDAVSDIYV
ncbi:hypothetical protein H072_699 [Dactylellina haptotyla CBS 200.50]|uniref:Peptidase C14 caspase domain-containing protein n=1 Tax=Dactylellina haptotyla (strain CBS 200.50) TaxID=1284197 RepID=S8AR72_DACHA|nr:hypothetical protein H072_699 [Dactylellina haptotyla CBS 200.50]